MDVGHVAIQATSMSIALLQLLSPSCESSEMLPTLWLNVGGESGWEGYPFSYLEGLNKTHASFKDANLQSELEPCQRKESAAITTLCCCVRQGFSFLSDLFCFPRGCFSYEKKKTHSKLGMFSSKSFADQT